jgi:hypothetical protein
MAETRLIDEPSEQFKRSDNGNEDFRTATSQEAFSRSGSKALRAAERTRQEDPTTTAQLAQSPLHLEDGGNGRGQKAQLPQGEPARDNNGDASDGKQQFEGGGPADASADEALDESLGNVLKKRNQLNDSDTRKELLKDLGKTLSKVSPEEAKKSIDQLNQKLKDSGSSVQFKIFDDGKGNREINMRSNGERGLGNSAPIGESKPGGAGGGDKPADGKAALEKSIASVLDKKTLNDDDTRKEVLKDLGSTLSKVSPEEAKKAVEKLNEKLKDSGSSVQFKIFDDGKGNREINMRSNGERGPGNFAPIPSDSGKQREESDRELKSILQETKDKKLDEDGEQPVATRLSKALAAVQQAKGLRGIAALRTLRR